jgi:metal-responsive CopG/Arc/MetJ family transcriptional regulator
MKRISKTFTISFPPEMAKEVEEVAREERRGLSELFREAFRFYQQERELREIKRTQLILGQKLAAKGITSEEQLEQLLYEGR